MGLKKSYRSVVCGELTVKALDRVVTLSGWVNSRRNLGGLLFIDLRDRYGVTQLVFDPNDDSSKKAYALATEFRLEDVISVEGKVRKRPEGMANSAMTTGEIEVLALDTKLLSKAETTPFVIEDETTAQENLRLKYRYLDLRRPVLQKNLMIRHRMQSIVRNFLDENQFLEVDTPILYKSTPEGARDFVVPSRTNPSHFYALPQSPQTLKQLLMIGGMDRYYQIARCFRDEDLRADRQPEFSQIDIEASFLSVDEFFSIIEKMVARLWREVLGVEVKTPFLRMSYREAMSRFGSDKPDMRFGLEIQDVSNVFSKSEFQVFKSALSINERGEPGSIRAIVVKEKAESFSRKDLDQLTEVVKIHGGKGLVWMKIQTEGQIQSPAAKFLSDEEKKEIQSSLSLQAGDLVLIVADSNEEKALECLGQVRLSLGEKLELIPDASRLHESPQFLWVVDFPLLEYDFEEKRYFAKHHPFTTPQAQFVEDLKQQRNLGKMLASAYDLVLNGIELGGGSQRIFQKEVQDAMFAALGLSKEQAQEKFGFFLEALQYGTPPHGGIAFGIERLAAVLSGVGPIRDVMAFPKTQKGHCLMSSSPSELEPEQLHELGIATVDGKKNS